MAVATFSRTVEVVERVIESETGGRATDIVVDGSDVASVVWADNGHDTGVCYAIGGHTLSITRGGKGGRIEIDIVEARHRMVPVFVVGDADEQGNISRRPVAAFGDSPDAYPEITDLGWFCRTDQFVAQRWACDSLADVAVELAFAHLT